MGPDTTARHCPRCGGAVRGAEAEHPACDGPGAGFDPPRFCGRCGERLDVRVFPTGFRATCRRCDDVHPARDPIEPGAGRPPSA